MTDAKTEQRTPLYHCISLALIHNTESGFIYAKEGFIISHEFNQAKDEPLMCSESAHPSGSHFQSTRKRLT